MYPEPVFTMPGHICLSNNFQTPVIKKIITLKNPNINISTTYGKEKFSDHNHSGDTGTWNIWSVKSFRQHQQNPQIQEKKYWSAGMAE